MNDVPLYTLKLAEKHFATSFFHLNNTLAFGIWFLAFASLVRVKKLIAANSYSIIHARCRCLLQPPGVREGGVKNTRVIRFLCEITNYEYQQEKEVWLREPGQNNNFIKTLIIRSSTGANCIARGFGQTMIQISLFKLAHRGVMSFSIVIKLDAHVLHHPI